MTRQIIRPWWNLAKTAWGSSHALKLLPIGFLAFFSLISVPLVEGPDSSQVFYSHFLPSLVALPAGFLVLYGFWVVYYRKGPQPPWLLFVAASVAGAVRGSALYFAGQLLAPEISFPSLGSRVSIAILTWNLTLAGFALVNFLLIEPTVKWGRLTRELSLIEGEITDLQAQLDWLTARQVSGLDQQIRDEFLKVSAQLANSQQNQAAAHEDLAKVLRNFARQSIHTRSRNLWPSRRRSPLVRATISAVAENPLPIIGTTLIYSVGYLINEVRLYGFSSGILVALALSAFLATQISLIRRVVSKWGGRAWALLVIPTLQGAASMVAYQDLLVGRGESYLIFTTSTSILWTVASLLVAGLMSSSFRLFEPELANLEAARQAERARLDWLIVELEATERELAQYLHGIVQSRVMAQAIKIEQSTSHYELETALQDLESAMSSPMGGFRNKSSDLATGIEVLRNRWAGFVELSFVDDTEHPTAQVEATLHVVQEAISNAMRHGQATAASVALCDREGIREIVITDNGEGRKGRPGLGSAVYDSASQGNWSLEFDGSGTTLRLSIPLLVR